MANSNNHSNPATASSLEAVALHERKLLSAAAEAEHEAAQIVAQARLDGEKVVEQKLNALHEESEAIRVDAAAQRAAERAAILEKAEAEIQAIRSGVEGQLAAAADELVTLVLPKASAGGSS